ncbi:MAG TPA: GNAT family N-acetyltransferase [Ktedonobacterales bacterium]|nr:GNAT family N-acetyltransferase [Ktedonobacterales bacterium]
MVITRHAFRGVADMSLILDLVRSQPDSCRHVIDLPWRLSSPAINEGRDAAYWQDAAGRVVGFAAWQYYWAALDFFIQPDLPSDEAQGVEADLFAWADGRFRERDEERGRPLPYAVEFRDDDDARRQMCMAHGFLLDEYDSYVSLTHTLASLAPVPGLPDGFALRLLQGEPEAAAYAALHRVAFGSDSMTPEWRARTLRTPQYRADLDLVVTAPDGGLAGFCVGWYEPARRLAQIEPIGVHPRYQQHGLARILLLETLHRFKRLGAERALVETNLERTPARHTYEAVGFEQTHTIRRLEKWAGSRRVSVQPGCAKKVQPSPAKPNICSRY